MNVYTHNEGSYEMNIVLKDITVVKGERVFILTKQGNKLYNFRVGTLSSVYSLNFLPQSLAKLSDSIVESKEWRKSKLAITYDLLKRRKFPERLIESLLGKSIIP